MKKKVTILGFIIFGTAFGLVAVWFRQNTDTVFLFNIPGTLFGDAVYGLAIRFFGDQYYSQAHYTIPWLFRIPQVYVPASILFWGLIGTIFTMFLELRIIAWIMGVYLVVIGGLYLLLGFGLV